MADTKAHFHMHDQLFTDDIWFHLTDRASLFSFSNLLCLTAEWEVFSDR